MRLLRSTAAALSFWRRLSAPPPRIAELRDRRLRELVRHAGERVPLYRRRFEEHGVDPAAVHTVADLHRLPILSRDDLRDASWDERLAAGTSSRSLIERRTSGSTGSPLRLARTRGEDRRLSAVALRTYAALGVRPWDLRAGFTHFPPRFPRARRRAPFPFVSVPWSAPAEEAWRIFEAYRPAVIVGRLSHLEGILDEVGDAALRRFGPRLVVTGGEASAPESRRRLGERLGCPVRDLYGAHEAYVIAWECGRCGAYHTCDDSVVVEVLEDGRPVPPGGTGDVVVTALSSFAMPFLRWSIGDRARVPEAAPTCEVRFGALAEITGRRLDRLRFRGGPGPEPLHLARRIGTVEGVRRYRVVQTGPDRVAVRFETDADPALVAAALEAALTPLLPEGARIEAEAADRILVDGERKHRWIVAWNDEADAATTGETRDR